MSYSAYVITANDIVPHPNPEVNRLNLLRYNGAQFVIGKDIQVGEAVVLFPEDGCLSHDFCYQNNLYRNASLNKDPLRSGFFEENRRVRSQPFKKEKSQGFVATLNMFEFTGEKDLLVPGYSFENLGKFEICKKYYTEKTLKAMKSGTAKKEKNVVYELPEHYDTQKFSYSIPVIEKPALVFVTEKVHGTSARTGRVIVTRKNINFIQSFLNKMFGLNLGTTISNYECVSGTRRTIANDRLNITTEGEQDYYRWEAHTKISPQLHKGEVVYYEIVGYDSHGGSIMELQDLNKINKIYSVPSHWPNPMTYTYGVPKGERDIYVYRITRTNDDGIVTELPFYQVQQRARELGLKTVPVLAEFVTSDVEHVKNVVSAFVNNSSSVICPNHLMEGVVVRIENSDGIVTRKEKNEWFGILEGYLKTNENYVDTEEVN